MTLASSLGCFFFSLVMSAVCQHINDMKGVFSKLRRGTFDFLGQLKVTNLITVRLFEDRSEDEVPLRKEGAVFLGVTVGSGCLLAELFIYVACNGLVQRDVLRREIVVIFIIAVKIF